MVTAVSVRKVAVPLLGGQMIRPCLEPDAPTSEEEVEDSVIVDEKPADIFRCGIIYPRNKDGIKLTVVQPTGSADNDVVAVAARNSPVIKLP